MSLIMYLHVSNKMAMLIINLKCRGNKGWSLFLPFFFFLNARTLPSVNCLHMLQCNSDVNRQPYIFIHRARVCIYNCIKTRGSSFWKTAAVCLHLCLCVCIFQEEFSWLNSS